MPLRKHGCSLFKKNTNLYHYSLFANFRYWVYLFYLYHYYFIHYFNILTNERLVLTKNRDHEIPKPNWMSDMVSNLKENTTAF